MAQGPDSSFDSYVEQAGARLLKLAYLLTGNLADADELLQDSLSKVFVAWSQVQAATDRGAYVRRVMLNTNRRRYRRHRVVELLDGHAYECQVHERGGGHDDFAMVEDRRHLAQALGALPRRQRLVVVLRYYEDLSETDVASLMGCSVGTVKSQASKALSKLRNHPSLRAPLPEPEPNGASRA